MRKNTKNMYSINNRKGQLIPSTIYLLLLCSPLITACIGQNEKDSSINNDPPLTISTALKSPPATNQNADSPFAQNTPITAQIGEYIREVFQDKHGNLWFGTLMYGLAKYDGTSLTYFTQKDGLIGNQINGITEDIDGNLWFATTKGVSRYDGKIFTNFTEKDGLGSTETWSILADKTGTIWVGTVKGMYRFNGLFFSKFQLPKAAIKEPTFVISPDLIWSIIADKNGHIWFGTDGFGVCKYDGNSFSHFTKKDGLNTNNIASLLADSQGNMWFGASETSVLENKEKGLYKYVDSEGGGLSRYDGKTFQQFPTIKGLTRRDIGPIYEAKNGDIWIASKNYGAFRYDGKKFTNFKEQTGVAQYNCVQSILEDNAGNLWFGFSGGLFRFEEEAFVNVTKNGPWE